MKPTTELTLTGDIAVTLECENANPSDPNQQVEIAKVGGMRVTLSGDAQGRKEAALEVASLIVAIASPDDQAQAVATVAQLKAYTNAVEQSRKEVKQPFWDAGKAIDDVARKEAAPVLEEIRRVERLLGDYQRRIDEAAAAARRAQEEAERKLREEQEARLREEQRLREEAERKSREAEAAAAAARTKAQKAEVEKARLEAELAAAKANQLAAERRNADAAAEFAPAPEGTVALPTKPQGAAVRREYDIAVTDIGALYRAHGNRFVKLEPDLAAIKYYLGTPGVAPDALPGVKATPVTNVRVRAARNQ